MESSPRPAINDFFLTKYVNNEIKKYKEIEKQRNN
jgi:hypothetical protein